MGALCLSHCAVISWDGTGALDFHYKLFVFDYLFLLQFPSICSPVVEEK
jgi:hypothetical protein